MAAENENLDEKSDVGEGAGKEKPKLLQSNIVKLIIRFLGWGIAVLAGIAIIFLTNFIVIRAKGDEPDKMGIIEPERYEKLPAYGVLPLDGFTINLDRTDDADKTTVVTVSLVLAYPDSRKEIAKELTQRKEQISDALQSIIARKRFEDINTADKREHYLKLELINAVNNNIISKGIVDIYITQFEIARF
jgi:flagellar basal body-associated protein FliL